MTEDDVKGDNALVIFTRIVVDMVDITGWSTVPTMASSWLVVTATSLGSGQSVLVLTEGTLVAGSSVHIERTNLVFGPVAICSNL